MATRSGMASMCARDASETALCALPDQCTVQKWPRTWRLTAKALKDLMGPRGQPTTAVPRST